MPMTVQNFGQKRGEPKRRKMTVASNTDGFSRKVGKVRMCYENSVLFIVHSLTGATTKI